jgi:hypothetical protein
VTSPDQRYAGGCTGYGAFDVPALAGFLDEDLAPSWAQVSAWYHVGELTRDHLKVLRQARETITRIWPPSANQAAAAYVAHLDALIASMENMNAAAEANGGALSGILTVLTDAKGKMDKLHEEWKQADSSWLSVAAGVVVGVPAVIATAGADQRNADQRAKLNADAADLMRTTDRYAYEYLPKLVVVPRAQAPDIWWSPSGGPGPAPTRSGSGSGGVPLRRPSIPSPPPPALGASSSVPSLAASSPPAIVGDSGSGLLPTPAGTSAAPADSVPGVWVQTPIGRALRSGAVLGTPEGEVQGVRTSAGSSSKTTEYLKSSTGTGTPETGLWSGGLGATGRPGDRQRRRVALSDTEWPVRRGVPPVLEPGPEPRHDPGPGVIGIDR